MDWEKPGMNYWENEDCPKEYLEEALIELIEFVEGEEMPANHFNNMSRENIVKQVEKYEYYADK